MYRFKDKMITLFLLLTIAILPFVTTTQLAAANPHRKQVIADDTTRRWQPYDYRPDYSQKKSYKYSNGYYNKYPMSHHFYQTQRDYPYYYYNANPQLYYEGNDNGSIYYYR